MIVTGDIMKIASLVTARNDAIFAYPTETFYGLGARIDDAAALERILAVKGRQAARGMIVLVDGLQMAEELAVVGDQWRELLMACWPGAVSVILPARERVPELLAPGGSIALRHSPHALAADLVRELGPLTSTSANRSGEPPADTAQDVLSAGLELDAVLDGGRTAGGLPSTLVDLRGERPVCLREGAVPFRQILEKWDAPR